MSDEEYNQQRGGGIVLAPGDGDTVEQAEKSASRPKLNALNFLNFFFYVANVVIVYLVGNAGLNGLPSNAVQSLKYQVCFPFQFYNVAHFAFCCRARYVFQIYLPLFFPLTF